MTIREPLSMDFGWRFHLGDDEPVSGGLGGADPTIYTKTRRAVGAVRPDFDDSEWQEIDLPHDWVVALGFDPRADRRHGHRPVGREYPSSSIGWYRKTFNLPQSDEGKRLSIEFDGIYRDSTAWLNGHRLGRHLSGYTGFRYDISDCANYGDENVLVVRVDARGFELWSYEGAGIYRHVWLVKADPLHVAHWGTRVTPTVEKEAGEISAEVTIQTNILNESDADTTCTLISTVLDADGQVVAEPRISGIAVEAWGKCEIVQHVALKDAILWSVDSPHLYRLVTTIQRGANITDTYDTIFGIRTIRFDADEGFFLNGKSLKIKGLCCHQDHAGLGTALPDAIQEFRIRKLKEMGANAYRCAHNPPTPELLDVCDRLGMLVMDENRMMGSSPESLKQLKSLILRDRNHPCVILWALGNEEMIVQGTEVGARIAATMKRLVKRLDPTRPITLAMNGSWGSQVSQIMDVQGCNYIHCGDADKFHEDHPGKPMLGSETASTLCTRGIYAKDEGNCHVDAYGSTLPTWGATPEEMWRFWGGRPFVAGVFVWTGFDYRGETTPYLWPAVSSNFGVIDVCGFPKDSFYYYQSWWSDETVLHIFPHWNWPGKEGQGIPVWCYSNCDEVELFLNGKSLGEKVMPRCFHLEWDVEYVPGKLEAKGYKGGREVVTTVVETTGSAAALRLTADRARIRADNQDVFTVAVAVVDGEGRLVSTADNQVTFAVSGRAKIIGVANGDPSSHEPDKADRRKAFNGLCMAIVQSGWTAGDIKLTGESPGLRSASVVVRAEECDARPFVQST